jgi:hypothetical protein
MWTKPTCGKRPRNREKLRGVVWRAKEIRGIFLTVLGSIMNSSVILE